MQYASIEKRIYYNMALRHPNYSRHCVQFIFLTLLCSQNTHEKTIPNRTHAFIIIEFCIFSLSSTATKDNETFQRSLLAAKIANDKKMGKKAGRDAPPVNIGWDSHKPVVSLGERERVIVWFCWAENY